ncbi:MAG: DUF3530 family protein [Gammaproteobacteria bacterium]
MDWSRRSPRALVLLVLGVFAFPIQAQQPDAATPAADAGAAPAAAPAAPAAADAAPGADAPSTDGPPADAPSAGTPAAESAAPGAPAADPAPADGATAKKDAPAAAIDKPREQAYAEAIRRRVDGAEVVAIGDAGPLALLRNPDGRPPRAAAVIVHDAGQNPQWPEVVKPLREALPGGGWTTLAVQMPVLAPHAPIAAYGATVPDAVKRLRTAVEFLRGRQIQKIALVGYGLGGVLATACVAEDGCGAAALVLISTPGGATLTPPMDMAAALAKVQVPVLDIRGGLDRAEVIAAAAQRARLMPREGGRYRNARIGGADHAFAGSAEALAIHVRGWLDRAVP